MKDRETDTANMVNELFTNLFEKNKVMGELPNFPQQQYAKELNAIDIKSEKVQKLLSQLKESQSQRADKLHPNMLIKT